MRIKSFAKINLGLEILFRRADGYHDIRTLFQSVDFYDVMDFTPGPGDRIDLIGDDPAIPWGEDNLIFKAARRLQERCRSGPGVKIRVNKRIPAGKGLGGGSSNAAMTLWALNALWSLNLSTADLWEIGSELGSDVPYFLHGGLCLGTGRGDVIEPLEDLPSLTCLIALPPIPVLTPEVYGALRAPLTSRSEDSKITEFLNTRDYKNLENHLEETVLRLYPQIKTYKSVIRTLNPELSLVTGSGSAVFGLFPETSSRFPEEADWYERYSLVKTRTISRERYWQNIRAGV